MQSGPHDRLSDVAGVTVGHSTIATGDLQTGVTVVRPHPGDPFAEKVPAAAVVINGFGKSVGLIQVNELGVLETPIALTNTFSVGTIATAQIRAAITAHPDIARTTTSVNPLVFECSDAYLSDMQALAVHEPNYAEALADATDDFARGSIGAGRGMTCFGLKGGIGTASRVSAIVQRSYTLGALVLANYGKLECLTLAGRRVGPALAARVAARATEERGSIIVVLATDAPLDHRQLRRVATRAAAGIGRTGGYYAHGSGDIALAFSTAARVPHASAPALLERVTLAEPLLDGLFEAAAEATEQAIVDALFSATTVTGFRGHIRYALTELAPDWQELAC